MKKSIILGLFSLVLAVSNSFGAAIVINTVRVTTNQLDIPYAGTYATKNLVKLGNYSLVWQQAGKGADVIATLPTNILSGTYTLTLQGSTPVSVEIGSVTAAAALNARVDLETARAGNAEAGLTNGINTEATRATAAEAGLSNSINAEIIRATGTETGLTNGINAETTRAENAEADLANSINGSSNSIVASVANNINAVSNNIVTSLTKNFAAAYSFGSQTVNAYSPVSFSNFIGDWTNNGTTFMIPATGVYQISFAINLAGFQMNGETDIQITGINNATTNGLGYFSFFGDYYGRLGTLSGQTIVQCAQGDLISIKGLESFTYGIYVQTNIPSATLSIIQIQ